MAERSTRGTGVITSFTNATGSNLADLGRARRVPPITTRRELPVCDGHRAPGGHGEVCGAEPATDWLTGIATGDDGFIRTDVRLTGGDLGPAWAALGRRPLPFETSIPGVFAVGDVRSGSMKRVAAATGEGPIAIAIAPVHKAIATLA